MFLSIYVIKEVFSTLLDHFFTAQNHFLQTSHGLIYCLHPSLFFGNRIYLPRWPHIHTHIRPILSFPLQKVDVHGDDPKKVDGISVTLRDINLFTTGLFGCEASAEESFHTALVRKQMTVLGKTFMRSHLCTIILQLRLGG